MSLRWSIIFYIVSVIWVYNPLIGQVSISGIISDKSDTPLSGCTIFIVDTSSFLLTAHGLSDDEGRFSIIVKSPGIWELKFRYIGYGDTSIYIDGYSRDSFFLKVQLEELFYDLPSVTILDKLIGMKRSGDTLTYNIHAYTKGNETVVGDILSRLPGIQITNNGDVFYLGRRLDYLLLDGNDLVGRDHFIVTQGLRSEIVDRVQLLENFHGDFDQKDQKEERYALDILLKKEHKSMWLGNAEFNLGLGWKYMAKLSLVRSSERGGETIYLKSSNTVIPGTAQSFSPSMSDILRKLPELRLKRWSLNEGNQGAPVHQNYFDVNDHQLKLISHNKGQGSVKHRSEASLSWSRFLKELYQERRYFSDQSLDKLQHDKNFVPFLGSLDEDLSWNISEDIQLIAGLKAGLGGSQEKITEVGLLSGTNYNVLSDIEKNRTDLQAGILCNMGLSKTWRLKIFQGYNFFSDNSDGYIEAQDTLFNRVPPNRQGDSRVEYAFKHSRHEVETGIELVKDLDPVQISLFSRRTGHNGDQEYTTSPDFWSGEAAVTRIIYELGLSTHFKFSDFRIVSDLSYSMMRFEVQSDGGRRADLLGSIQVKWSIDKNTDLILWGSQEVAIPGLDFTNGINILTGIRQFEFNQLVANQSVTLRQINLSYRMRPLTSRSIFFASIGARFSDGAFTVIQYADQGFTQGFAVVLPSSWNAKTSNMWWYTAREWQIHSSINANYSKGTTLNTDREDIPYTYFSSFSNVKINYSALRDIELRFNFSVNTQHQRTGDIISYWDDLTIGFGLKYNRTFWALTVDAGRKFNRFDDRDLNLSLFNAVVEYRRWNPVIISVKGYDLLNLNRSFISQVDLSPSFSIATINRRIPGRLFLSMRWEF